MYRTPSEEQLERVIQAYKQDYGIDYNLDPKFRERMNRAADFGPDRQLRIQSIINALENKKLDDVPALPQLKKTASNKLQQTVQSTVTQEQIEQALINANKAGRTEDVRVLEQMLQRGMATQSTTPSPENQQEDFYTQLRNLRRSSDEESGFIENVLTGFGSGVVTTGELASLGGAALLDEDAELDAREKIQAAADFLRPEGGDQDALSYQIASGLGSVAGALGVAAGTAYGAGALGVGALGTGIAGLIGAGAVGIGAGAGEASERARAAGATEEERSAATLRGAAIGSLEVIPLARILRIPGFTKLAKKIGGKTVREGGNRIRSALTTGGAEAAQEASAAFLQNLNERGYNAEKELLDAGIIDEAIVGGGTGVIVQAVADFFVRGKTARQSATESTSDVEEVEVEVTEPTRTDEEARETEAASLEARALAAAERDDERKFEQASAEAAQPDLFPRELEEAREARPEAALRGQLESEGAERVPQREGIRDEPKPTPPQPIPVQEDMVDRLDKMEIDDAEIAEIEAMLQADAVAEAELDRVRGRSERETQAAAIKDEARADKMRPREAALEAVIGEPTTGSYVNLEKRFSKELSRRNIAKGERAKPTKRESQRIRRAADAFAGMRPQEQQETKPQEQQETRPQEPLETIESTPEDTQLTDLEARIPERRARASATPSQPSFPGMGRPKTPPVEETPPAPKIVTKEFMDGLGVSPKAPIRKRTEGKDLNDPVIRKQFTDFANNQSVAEQTRLNVARELEGVPEAQLELFQPRRRGRPSATVAPEVRTPPSESVTPTTDRRVAFAENVDSASVNRRAAPTTDRRVAFADNVDSALVDRRTAPITEVPTPPSEEVASETDRRVAQIADKLDSIEAKTTTPTAKTKRSTTTRKQDTTKKSSKTKTASTTRRGKKTTPSQAPKDTASAQLTERFEQLLEPVKQYARQISQTFNETVGKERTTPDDRLKILTLLNDGAAARDKVGKAVITYLGRVPRPIDGLYMAIFDVANTTPQFRKTPDMDQNEVTFFQGMGSKPAQQVLDWAQANLSPEINKWIDETLAQEIREIQRIQSTDYVDMFRQREAKLVAKEAAEQAQVEADMRQDLRTSLEEIAQRSEKNLARGSVYPGLYGLDRTVHPSVETALRFGDLRGALVYLNTFHEMYVDSGKLYLSKPQRRARPLALATKLNEIINDRANLKAAQAATRNSKVKNIVYHGSAKKDITEFKPGDATQGLYFSPRRSLAESYHRSRLAKTAGSKLPGGGFSIETPPKGLEGEGRVYEVMLDIRNPLIIDDLKNMSLLDRIDVALGRKTKLDVKNEKRIEVRERTMSSMLLSKERIAELKSQGYDGIMNENASEYVAFDASQVHMIDSAAGGTRVEIVDNLKNAAGNPVAGLFDPKTNTIKLDSETGMSPHVLLHEATHAATAATLANKSHPLTKQLTKLFEDVKDYLGTAYGAKDVDEFVAEAMSNPEFQAELAAINPDGSKINALQRFYNSVGNFLRKLVGMRPKEIGSAKTAADMLIEGILAPAPKFRNANELAMESTAKGVKEEMKGMGETQKALHQPLTQKFRGEWADGAFDTLSALNQKVAFVLPKLVDSQALSDIAKRADAKLGKLAAEFHELMERQRGSMARADDFVRDQVKVVDKWIASGGTKEKQKNLNDLIYSQEYGATIYQVDPTKPVTEYQGKIDDNGNDLEAIWRAQRDDWEALGADGRKAYLTMRDMYRSLHENLKDAINGRIDIALSKNPDAAAELKKEVFAKLFDSNTLDVYFPLLREGQYKLEFQYKDSAVDAERDKYVFQMFDSKRQRDRVYDALLKDPDVITNTVNRTDGDFKTSDFNNAPSSSFVKQVLDSLSANKVDDKVQAEIMRLFIDALPESSFAKSLQKRKGTPGYMQDAVYAMKSKGFDLARQVEKLKYNALIQNMEVQLNELEQPKDKQFEFDTLREEIKVRMEFAKYGAKQKGLERYVRMFNQLAFVGTIGFNVASAMVQTAQIPMFVMPMLGARYGYQKAYDELMTAASFVTGARGMGETKLDKIALAHGLDAYYDITDNGDFVVKKDEDIPEERLKELERIAPVVRLASERGHLNRSFIFDALGLQEGGRARRTDTLGRKISAAIDYGTGISAMMFNQSERFNRQVTMVASYNLALDRITAENPNMPKAQRQQMAAEEALYDTQEYNGGSTLETAPRVAQEHIGRVAMMYKTYGLRMYYTMLKTAATMLSKESDPAMRKIARNQLIGIHGSSLFFAGVHGIPLYGAFQLMADLLLLGDEEDDFNSIVREYVGEGWYKGAFNQVLDTLEIGADVASRVRLTGLLLQENRYNPNPSAEEAVGYYIGGPALSVAKRTGRGIIDLYNGEIQRGIESIMPVGFSNMYKSVGRYQQDGGIYTRRGDPIYDDMTGGELFAQFFGFAPAEYIRIQENNQRVKGIDIAIANKKSNITKKYYVAARQGDWDALADAKREIAKFNKAHPSFAITLDTLDRSIKQHIKTSETMYNGVTLSPAMRKLAEDHLMGTRNGFMLP